MDITRLMQMRDSLASLGAPLGVTEQVDQDEVHVAYRDIILREEYQWPRLPNAAEVPDASVDVTIRVYENESLFDKLDRRRPFYYWIRIKSDNRFFRWRMLSDAGMVQTRHETRDTVDSWKQSLFTQVQGGHPPVLMFRHTDPNFLSMFPSRPKPRVRDASVWSPKRRP